MLSLSGSSCLRKTRRIPPGKSMCVWLSTCLGIFSHCVLLINIQQPTDPVSPAASLFHVIFCLCLWFFSIEYWFRCMDVDGDGVLSMYELEYFYEEQCERMERMGIEPLPFQDLLCQMLDLVKPESTG